MWGSQVACGRGLSALFVVGNRCVLVVVAVETGGRWSSEAGTASPVFVVGLASPLVEDARSVLWQSVCQLPGDLLFRKPDLVDLFAEFWVCSVLTGRVDSSCLQQHRFRTKKKNERKMCCIPFLGVQ